MINTLDIAWLAGILEGEGCFRLQRNSPGITLNMTDHDVVVRAANLLNTRPPRSYIQRPGRKPMWCAAVHGAHAVAWMMTLYTFLGERRRAKIRELISAWSQKKMRLYSTWGMPVCAKCHPKREMYARELCNPCYQRSLTAELKRDPEWVEKRRKYKRQWEAAKREKIHASRNSMPTCESIRVPGKAACEVD